MTLRARIVALVVGAVVLTLLAMGLPGRRIAIQEYEASVHAVLESSVEEVAPAGPVRPASLTDLEAEVRTPLNGSRRIWVSPGGRVRAASEPSLEGVDGTMDDEGTVVLQWETGRGLQRIRFGGGREVVAPDGSAAGRLFRLPAIDSLNLGGEEFTRALDRRLLIWAALVLILVVGLAIALVGHTLGPLQRLQRAAQQISTGDLAARAGSGGPPEVRAVADAFDRMAEHLESSEDSRRRMIRNVAHDLRTPLTNLRGQLEALQDGLLAADEAALASLHEEAMLLSRLVSDLDALARADEGALELSPTTFDLTRLVGDVVAGFIQSGRLSADRVSTTMPPSLLVHADPAAIGRALRNIVENAVVHATAAQVDITARRVSDQIELEIRDHGPGIDPQHLPHVTERLYRSDAARGRETGGSGLGLAIALEMMNASRGTLTVANADSGGTRVVLRLPAEPTGTHRPYS